MNPLQAIVRKAYIEWHSLQSRAALNKHKLSRGDTAPVLGYLHMDYPHPIPNAEGMLSGGGVKYQYLSNKYQGDILNCNLLYVVSSWRYHHTYDLLKLLKSKGVKIVWNQNGSFFPHFYGESYARKMNQRMFREMQLADFVFFQSEFAKKATEQLMGTFDGPSEILYNCIDTQKFVPCKKTTSPTEHVTILMAGSHNDPYRLRLGVETLSALHQLGFTRFKLLIAGNILPKIQNEVKHVIVELKLENAVKFLGPYTQSESVSVYQRGDILLHTKFMDVCPSMVLEAMACGLPVVYSKTGGTPELVGEEAGIGIETKQSLYDVHLPDSQDLANAILNVSHKHEAYSVASRTQVESNFDLTYWMEEHEKRFSELLG